MEDYEFRPQPGDLDASNGRFCVTPEYPTGTYAYFFTTSEQNQPAFPYFLFERFRGRIPGVQDAASSTGVQFIHGALEAGKPVNFEFRFSGTLEIVHEKPLHLMVVSEDLDDFVHIHPTWKIGDRYTVTHTFSKPGKYRLFAQFTPPGEPEHLKSFEVIVTGTVYKH